MHLSSFFIFLEMDIIDKGKEFVALQEERVRTYGELDQAHKRYLQSAPNYDFSSYKVEVAKATDTFNRLSIQIIALEKDLERANPDLASTIRKV